jgi:hypothetical protein
MLAILNSVSCQARHVMEPNVLVGNMNKEVVMDSGLFWGRTIV